MSELGRTWRDWHLTASGWKRGGTGSSPRQQADAGVSPTGTVLSCRYEEWRSGPAADDVKRHVETLWADDSGRAAMLEARFGPCPQEL